MADIVLPESLRGLVLSASEIRDLTGWPEPMIEDYLNIIENFTILSQAINEKNNIVKVATLVTFADSPYEIKDTDEEVFFDTTAGAIVANLRPGVKGRNYRLINVADTGNTVTLNPYGTENLFGENNFEYIYNQEAFIITFYDGLGWW